MGRLEGKVALITGAARGQGRSHALTFAREGAAGLILVDVCKQLPTVPYAMASESDLAETARLVTEAGARATAVAADVRSFSEMQAAVERGLEDHGRIDIVGANAGIATYGCAWEVSEEAFRETIDVNLIGTWHTVKAAVPQMIERGEGGSVICTSSCAGLKGFANAIQYSASKFGIIGIVQTLAQELAPHSIRVNAVCPFSVDTDMILNEPTYQLMTGGQNPTYEAAREAFASLVALPTPWAHVEDVSAAYTFLASDESRFVTGHSMTVDAGYLLS